ncbi:ABC transporter permease [Chitinimonas koreensis]|uniref:ABC transporter permease n=1 Tax=Chitinimonas koreensis TaxID=356302 RepID=UPI000405B1F5|nr:ABC transporter permease [Chitinimonas koreensis]
MKIVILWTDWVVFLVIAATLFYGWKVRRTPHLANTWRRAFTDPTGAAAATVLGFFIAIGVVDSLHYRPLLASAAGGEPAYATETRSALDALLAEQADNKERSYSAPLAYQGYEKEAVTVNGQTSRIYPRLAHAGLALKDPAHDWAGDVGVLTAVGVAKGGLLAALIVCGAVLLLARSRRIAPGAAWRVLARGESRYPLRSVLATTAVLCVLSCVALSLASEYHVFGTDRVGNDLFYVVLKSIRTALVIGTMSTLVTMPIAVGLGIMAGYLRGWVDDVIQYVYTVINSIPYVLLIAAAVLILMVFIDNHADLFPTAAERTDARLFFLCVILGMTSWTDLCRLIRGEVIKLREAEYIQAAQAFGVGTWRILSVHLLPNVMHLILISLVINFSGLVLAEAVLSYVGIGVDPSMQSFGTLINTARLELSREPTIWWTLATAFTFMFTLVLSANLFSDSIRDAFDPRAIHR